MARKKKITRKFRVTEESLTQLCNGNEVYPVKNGVIELPRGQTWYKHLVGGLLIPEETAGK